MRLTIEVDDKLGEKIKSFCKLNGLTYSQYLSDIIEKQFNVDRFGDLNDKIKKKIVLKSVEVETDKTTKNDCFEEKQPRMVSQEEDKKEENKSKGIKRQLKVK